MTLDPATRFAMLDAMPQLHRFAMSLCRDFDRANDLTQQTLLRACANIDKFMAGSNMIAWLITILRNEHYSECRKRRREVEDIDGAYAESLTLEPDQAASLEYNELCTALAELPSEMRRAFILVSWDGIGYERAAQACNCAVGTIKSRVHRARARLAKALSNDWPSGQGNVWERAAIRGETFRSATVIALAPDLAPLRLTPAATS
jgi:RNA polymerase sigma-70 factor (ECF subfamily)